MGGEKPRGGRMGRAMAAVRQRTLGSQPQLGDHVQALWIGYKPVTRPDQRLLDRLLLLLCSMLFDCAQTLPMISMYCLTPNFAMWLL